MSLKKKIIITQSGMPIGGAEKALLAMLENIDYSRFDVDLFLYNHTGELMKELPKEVKLLPENKHYHALSIPLIQSLKHSIRAFCTRIFAKFSTLILSSGKDNYTIYDEIDRWGSFFLPTITNDTYDACISYLANHHIEHKKITAKKYIAWIHTDYSFINLNKKINFKGWKLFNHIISISESVHQGFSKIYPSLQSRLTLIENSIPVQSIRDKSKDFEVIEFDKNKYNFLSVGRYCIQKNFPLAVEIMYELCKLRKDVMLYIIGFGDDFHIKKRIIELDMQEHVILLGKKENPYPYMRECDVYIQTSLYEGKCVAVQEAQSLGKPAIITNYPTATSQLENDVDGLIIPFNAKQAALQIHELLKKPSKLSDYSKECSLRNYSHADSLNKLYELI